MKDRLLTLWFRYERYISAGGLGLGFVFDLIIADSPDSLTNNLLLLLYLILAGMLIVVLNISEIRRRRRGIDAEPLFLLFFLQFCFGGLASNLLVLYGRSGTFVGSAIFLGILLAMLIGNEFLRNRYAQLRFNVGVYYLLLLSYSVIATPVFITHTIGTFSFLLAGVLSLVVIAGFLTALFFIVFRGRDTDKLWGVSFVVGGIFLVFNVFYFLNIIPPVPLSLRQVGIYHSLLLRSEGGYVALYEPAPWWQFWRDTNSYYTLSDAGSAFCFSSVFAPSNLATPIYHKWERYDEQKGGWQTESRVTFPISGGRAQGYRGFSVKSALQTGSWRCSVETPSGALIGRTSFEVVSGPAPELSQKTL